MLRCERCGIENETVTETTEPIGQTDAGDVIEEDATLCGECHQEVWDCV